MNPMYRQPGQPRAEFKAILADVQQMTTPLPTVYELENSLEILLQEQAYLKKLDSVIIYFVDEDLEEEVETAELYIDCLSMAISDGGHRLSDGGYLPSEIGSSSGQLMRYSSTLNLNRQQLMDVLGHVHWGLGVHL